MRAKLWNTGGWVAWHTGQVLYRAGLALCGLAGDLDARADDADMCAWERSR